MPNKNEPLLLRPSGKDYIWGGSRLNDEFEKNIDLTPLAETWECYTHPDGPSYVVGGAFDGQELAEVLKTHPEYLGERHKGENTLPIAKRELLEETGYVSDDWQYIGATVESSAKLTNYMHLYFANHCRKVSEQHLDPTEELDVLVVPLKQAVEMVMNNEICCNSSAHGILWAAKNLGV